MVRWRLALFAADLHLAVAGAVLYIFCLATIMHAMLHRLSFFFEVFVHATCLPESYCGLICELHRCVKRLFCEACVVLPTNNHVHFPSCVC